MNRTTSRAQRCPGLKAVTIMSNTKRIFAAIVSIVLLVVGTIVILEWFGPKRTIVIDISGSAGDKGEVKVEGEVEVDGVLKHISVKLPAKLTYEAHKVAFAFVAIKEHDMDGIGIVSIFIDGAQDLSAAAPSSVGGEIVRPRLFRSYRPGPRLWSFSTGRVSELGR